VDEGGLKKRDHGKKTSSDGWKSKKSGYIFLRSQSRRIGGKNPRGSQKREKGEIRGRQEKNKTRGGEERERDQGIGTVANHRGILPASPAL